MPYTAPIGPAAPGQTSIWDFFDDKVGVTGASADAQQMAYQDLQDTDFNTGGYVDSGIVPTGGITAWLKKNSTAVYVGTAALVAMAMFGGRRR